jgi:uncharacterized protein (DUF433 family)
VPYSDPARTDESNTPVWILIDQKREGISDVEILERNPGLTLSELYEAYEYYCANKRYIDRVIANQDD